MAATVRFLIVLVTSVPGAELLGDDVSDEYRFTLSPHHDIKGNLTGSAEFGYYWNSELDKQTYTVLWPELNYNAQFTRPPRSSGLEHTENLIQLNIKLALNKGILQRLFDVGNTDD